MKMYIELSLLTAFFSAGVIIILLGLKMTYDDAKDWGLWSSGTLLGILFCLAGLSMALSCVLGILCVTTGNPL